MCFEQPSWGALPPDARAELTARQGQPMPGVADVIVADPETGIPVAEDGETAGEIMVRGNTIMTGYLKDAEATAEAFRGGWLHSGDIAVRHPDGYIEIRDRAKDIIISGGENISSVEVEAVLYQNPAVLEAAVVAAPHPRWGETPCAFVTLKAASEPPTAEQIISWCRDRLAHFKCPTRIVFSELPKTATGKIMKNELRERARSIASQPVT
jgi:fatty-acyl-CoA synthase